MREKLGQYVTIKTGKLDANASSNNGQYPFFTCAVEPLKINTYSYDCECVLLAGNGDLNVKYYFGKFDAYQRTYIIESKNKSKLSVRYLYYYLDEYVKTLRKLSIGGVIKYIKLGNLTDAPIFIPSLSDQNKIISVLDKVSELIALRKRQLDLLDEMVKARFVEMFGDLIVNNLNWSQVQLSNVATTRLGKMLDAKKQTGKNTYPYLANFNVQWFQFKLDNLNQMDFDESDQIEFALEYGDLLVCEGGEVGRCAVWKNQVNNCFFQKALHRIRCDKSIIIPDYLAWWFKVHANYNSFDDIVGSKATIPHLTGIKLKQLMIEVPPIELQNQFADFVQQVEKSKATVQRGLDRLILLKSALMQEYFG